MESNQGDEFTHQAPIHSGFGLLTTAEEVLGNRNLKGKVAIVTGGYSGIGLETTRVLAGAGATVIVAARSPEKAREAVAGIANVELEALDLMVPKSIDAFSERFLSSGRPLDMLINSAGIMASPLMRDERGYEAQFATNHLGHFQLTARLWPALKKAARARVIAVSSRGHRMAGVNFNDPNFETTPYDKWKAYGQSKSANILFALELDRLAKRHGVRAFSLHPGVIPTTDLLRFTMNGETGSVIRNLRLGVNNLINQLLKVKAINVMTGVKTIKEGAATQVWCATNEILVGMGGVYCEDCDIAWPVPAVNKTGNGVRPWAIDPDNAKRLWQMSEKLTGVRFEFQADV